MSKNSKQRKSAKAIKAESAEKFVLIDADKCKVLGRFTHDELNEFFGNKVKRTTYYAGARSLLRYSDGVLYVTAEQAHVNKGKVKIALQRDKESNLIDAAVCAVDETTQEIEEFMQENGQLDSGDVISYRTMKV